MMNTIDIFCSGSGKQEWMINNIGVTTKEERLASTLLITVMVIG